MTPRSLLLCILLILLTLFSNASTPMLENISHTRNFYVKRHYFSCKHPFDITSLNSTYTQMESKGLYKAMGELDLLFNYIETYLASKRCRTHRASV